jgi:hypothetical protein
MERISLGSTRVELSSSVGREFLDRAIALVSPASAVALKGRSGAILDVELTGLNIGKELSGSLALRENVGHGISNILNLEVRVALFKAVDNIVSSDLKSLHTESSLARHKSVERVGGVRGLVVLLGLLASNGSSKSSRSGSEKRESLEEHC